MNLNKLLKEAHQNRFSRKDIGLIKKSFEFVSQFEKNQSSNLNLALKIIQIKLDASSVAAAILHQSINNSLINKKQSIKQEFGEEITFLIEGLYQLNQLKYQGEKDYAENLMKMLLSAIKDWRIILIKLATRIEEIKKSQKLPLKDQKALAIETLEVYAPIAHRLRIGALKGELEDLAFSKLYPKQYQWLKEQINEKFQERDIYLKKITPIVKQKIEQEKIKVLDIHSRAKRHYSLYQKLNTYDMDLSRIYDLIALRIVVPTIKDCYATLGIIHKCWTPLKKRIKDYIASPKLNGYQSLHTTVYCENDKITEFQIRTPKIHWNVEYGMSAHWARPEKAKSKIIKNRQLSWLKEIKKWNQQIGSFKKSTDSTKIDLFKQLIYVVTPKGDVIELPRGSTPVDFAYKIHTQLGHRTREAKADGRIVKLNQPLSSGQKIEIITRSELRPNRDWLKFVKTSQAKSRIKGWFSEKK